jgi:hypothetical protein
MTRCSKIGIQARSHAASARVGRRINAIFCAALSAVSWLLEAGWYSSNMDIKHPVSLGAAAA